MGKRPITRLEPTRAPRPHASASPPPGPGRTSTAGASTTGCLVAAAIGRVARVRALRRFTVRAALPEPLAPLGDLVMNLRWSWHPDSLDLFEAVDPDTWAAVDHDPVRLLGEVDADRMAVLAKDKKFLRRLSNMHDDLQ